MTRRVTPTTKPPASEEDLRSALLTLADLPAGFSASTRTPKDDGEGICGGGGDKKLSLASVEADFDGDVGVFLGSILASYPPGQAVKSMDSARARFTGCKSFSFSDSSTPSDFTMSELSFPSLGDQSFALRAKGEAKTSELGGIPVEVNIVVIRHGDVVALLVMGGLRASVSDTEQVARKQAEKLEAF